MTGIQFSRRKNRWKVHVIYKGKYILVGYYMTQEAALAARNRKLRDFKIKIPEYDYED